MHTDDNYKGWFLVPGVQHGDRTLDEQWQGLEHFAADLNVGEPYRVLDIGCAEGLIAREFCRRHGASAADCVGVRAEELDAGRVLCADVPVRFFQADARKLDQLNQLDLYARYDVVLLLSIVHKMLEPFALLTWASMKADTAIAVRVPAPIYTSRGNRKIRPQRFGIVAQMRELNWQLAADPPTCRGEWLGVFTR